MGMNCCLLAGLGAVKPVRPSLRSFFSCTSFALAAWLAGEVGARLLGNDGSLPALPAAADGLPAGLADLAISVRSMLGAAAQDRLRFCDAQPV